MSRRVFKAKITGEKDLEAAFKLLPDRVRLGVIDALKAIGLLIRNRAVSKIQKGPKTGRRYKRGSITHQASSPGEAPATDTGKLASSAEFDVDEQGLWAIVSFSAFYARMLEFGTRFIRPRPFLFSSVDESKETIIEIFKQSIRARLK